MPLNTTQNIVLEIGTVNIDVQGQVINLSINRSFELNGSLVYIDNFNVLIPQSEVIQLFALTAPDTNTTLYQVLKDALYNYLITNNIAAGTIA